MRDIFDIAESTFEKLDYNFCRVDDYELDVSLPPNYNLMVLLKPEYDILHFSTDLNLQCKETKLADIKDSIVKANERIWLGHFDLLSSDNRIVYSLSIPFASTYDFEEDYFESIVDEICEECDRFYDYFKMVLSDEQIPDFSISYLFKDCIGEA